MPTLLLNLPDDTIRRVFADDADFADLRALADIIRFDPKADDPARFPNLLAGADAILTGWGSRPITPADLFERDSRPLLIAHAAGSVRGVCPKETLGVPGVRLSQSSAPMAVSVAQFTIGLMILGARQSLARAQALKTGERYAGAFAYQDLTGLTIGLVGLSQVGRRVPPLLAPFETSPILAYDPYAAPEMTAALGVTLLPHLDDLLARSDIVSLHAPVTEETKGLIDARRVGLLKAGALVVNTARPQIVDQDALFARATAGEIEYYTDVTTPEPLPSGHPAFISPHIFITPHIAGPTRQTNEKIGRHAVSEIVRFLQDQPLETEVTADRYDILA